MSWLLALSLGALAFYKPVVCAIVRHRLQSTPWDVPWYGRLFVKSYPSVWDAVTDPDPDIATQNRTILKDHVTPDEWGYIVGCLPQIQYPTHSV